MGTTAELIAEAREWLRRTPPHRGPSTGFVRRLADALESATKAIDEAGFADARRRVERGKLFTAADVAPLLAAVARRDGLLNDMAADLAARDTTAAGRALERADVLPEVAARYHKWKQEAARQPSAPALLAESVLLGLLAWLRARGPAPEPTPPEQARAEADRLRGALGTLLAALEPAYLESQGPPAPGQHGGVWVVANAPVMVAREALG